MTYNEVKRVTFCIYFRGSNFRDMNRALKSTGHQQDILNRLDLGDLNLSGRSRPRRNTRPSVAQNMGLVPRPPKPMTPYDWSQIENELIGRNAFSVPCSICLNPHGKKNTVVTSCKHTFHESCLNATKAVANVAKCPLCRSVYTQLGKSQKINIDSFLRDFYI